MISYGHVTDFTTSGSTVFPANSRNKLSKMAAIVLNYMKVIKLHESVCTGS